MTLSQEQVNAILSSKKGSVTFHGFVLRNINLSHRDLQGVFFAGIIIDNVNFRNSNLSHASFYGSLIERTDFSFSILDKTVFRDSIISQSSFVGIKANFLKKAYLMLKNY